MPTLGPNFRLHVDPRLKWAIEDAEVSGPTTITIRIMDGRDPHALPGLSRIEGGAGNIYTAVLNPDLLQDLADTDVSAKIEWADAPQADENGADALEDDDLG